MGRTESIRKINRSKSHQKEFPSRSNPKLPILSKNQKVILHSRSPWLSSIVLLTKKNCTSRICDNYSRFNGITKKDSKPLPRIDNTLDSLTGSIWFSTIDLKTGYWQVEMHPEDREKTDFSTNLAMKCGTHMRSLFSFFFRIGFL